MHLPVEIQATKNWLSISFVTAVVIVEFNPRDYADQRVKNTATDNAVKWIESASNSLIKDGISAGSS